MNGAGSGANYYVPNCRFTLVQIGTLPIKNSDSTIFFESIITKCFYCYRVHYHILKSDLKIPVIVESSWFLLF